MLAEYLYNQSYLRQYILRLRTRVGVALRQCHVALDYHGRDFSPITHSQESRAAHLFAYRNLTSLLRRIVYCVRGRYMLFADVQYMHAMRSQSRVTTVRLRYRRPELLSLGSTGK